MSFAAPEWFLLLPALLLLGWMWRGARLFSPLRLLLLLLGLVFLADPMLVRHDDSMDLLVVLDRSASTEDLVDRSLPEWQRLLEKSRPSRRDQLKVYDYAAEVVEHGADGDSFTGSRQLTRTNLALSHVAALADPRRPSRVLLFTDGYATEPLAEAATLLEKNGIPLDFRLIRDESSGDFRVTRLDLPERVQTGEPFLLGVTVAGSEDATLPLVIRRSGTKLLETSVKLQNGVGRAEFTDRITAAGAFEYQAEIIPEQDAHPGNNRASRWIEATGGPRVLLVTRYQPDPVAQALSTLNFSVDVESQSMSLDPGRLSGCRAVILNDVPAHEISREFLKALDFFVREQGGGLLMAGGKHSFGSGGYFQSSIDALLPVSMELKSEQRKLAVALAMVLDRSGSMAVSVSAGGKNLTKMDLANNGAVEAIKLLGAQDQVTIFAVDSAPYKIVPLTRIDDKQAQLISRTRKIQSMGGGIYVYEGLKAGWEELKKAKVGTRHLILFSDANDSEEPGDYKRLLEEMRKEGATVSVIGLGTRKDSDAKLLEDIAKRGGGRIFFSDNPLDIPKIFAQETVTIARSSFIDEPVGAQPTGAWAEVSPKSLDWLPQVGGYNLSYARPDATTALVSTDEYLAPLVAVARRGLGRSAAVSFPLGGEFSEPSLSWPGYADFVQTLTRWLMGMDLPPGIGLRHHLTGSRLTLDLLYDPAEWGKAFSVAPPQIRLAEEPGGVSKLPWQRIGPDRFTASRDLAEGTVVRGAVQVGHAALPFGPVTVGSALEWAFDPRRLTELRSVSAATGGRELVDLSKAWLSPPHKHVTNLRLSLALTMLILTLAEAFLTRTGWRLPVPAMPKLPVREKSPRRRPHRASTPVPEEPTPKEESSPPPAENIEAARRRARYLRAKDRK